MRNTIETRVVDHTLAEISKLMSGSKVLRSSIRMMVDNYRKCLLATSTMSCRTTADH